jgi:TldD protein
VSAHAWGELASDESAAALLDQALSTVDQNIEYADVRVVEVEELRVYHQLGHDPDERLEQSLGIGVRVLVDGAWGFASADGRRVTRDHRCPRRRRLRTAPTDACR